MLLDCQLSYNGPEILVWLYIYCERIGTAGMLAGVMDTTGMFFRMETIPGLLTLVPCIQT